MISKTRNIYLKIDKELEIHRKFMFILNDEEDVTLFFSYGESMEIHNNTRRFFHQKHLT